MTKRKPKVPEDGRNGVDRFSSNGYGIEIDGKKVTPPKEDDIEEIEETS